MLQNKRRWRTKLSLSEELIVVAVLLTLSNEYIASRRPRWECRGFPERGTSTVTTYFENKRGSPLLLFDYVN